MTLSFRFFFYSIRSTLLLSFLLIQCAAFAQSAPNDPSQLQGANITSSTVDLTWNDNSNDEDGFTMERSTDGQNFVPIATIAADTTNFSDSGLSSSTNYYYQLKAFNSAGDSGYTAILNVLTLPPSILVPSAPGYLDAKTSAPPAQLVWFYRPPGNSDTYTVSKRFGTYVLTKQDETVREDLKSKGAQGPFLQYILSNQIQDPGSCTTQPYRNQVADQIGDF